jgi:hypothetical protein
MFTAKGIGSCIDGTNASCSFANFCAYHSNIGSGSSEILYANMPYADTSPSTCDSGQHPNNDDADATLNVASHEHNEAITDPLGSAWYDSAGNENGDKCAWNFGTALGSTTSGAYNQVINGHDYYLQQEWSNASSSCVQTYGVAASPPVNSGLPVVSGSAQQGQTLSASAGVWSGTAPLSYAYQWQRCAASCVNVGSNSSSYALTSADVGSSMQVVVTASNSAGSASATSAQTAVVTAATSGTLTIPVASGGDDGDVSINDMGAAGVYPPTGSVTVWSTGTSFGVRRAGPLYGGYEVRTALLRFNTSSIPAGATITSASLRLNVTSRTSANNRNLVAEWDNGAAWPLDATDYTVTPSSTAAAGVAINSLTAGAVNTLPLQNLGSISTTGWTTIRLHVDGGQPSGDNTVFFGSYEAGAPAQLVITWQ